MEQILLNGINLDELLERIEKALFGKVNKEKPEIKEPAYLSRKEATRLLKYISPYFA